MDNVESITWRDLTGNKFSKSIDPAMLSDVGYIRLTSIRRVGDPVKLPFNVHYDRDYLIQYIARYICKPMFVIGKRRLLELVNEAWDSVYPNNDEKVVISLEKR